MARPLSEKMKMSLARKAKHCNNCGEYKNHADYDKDKYNPDGRRGYCKICRHKKLWQYQLRKKAKEGVRVNECVECYDLFMPRAYNKTRCGECRR